MKSIETQTGNYEPLVFEKGYTYNKVIIPSKYKPKPEKTYDNIDDFYGKCIDCDKKYLKIKKNSLLVCRACYLDSQGLQICKKCGSTKKKNDYIICYKCFTELKNK